MKKQNRSGFIWSSDEINYLKENYSVFGIKSCAKTLQRTPSSVSKKARDIGVSSDYGRWIFNKKEFTEIVSKSKTLSEILIKLKLRPAGGNFKTIKKYIYDLSLDTSHFTTKEDIARDINKIFVKKPVEYYLRENNHALGSNIKKRLFQEGFLEEKCSFCGQGKMWRGKIISLILDHKNGTHSDCRLENLRILCPNCNATLDTHCGRNNSKRNIKLIQKGIDINTDLRRLKFTKEKYIETIKRRISERPPLEELLKEIDAVGYLKTGKKYGVSDNSIRKWIKAYKKFGI